MSELRIEYPRQKRSSLFMYTLRKILRFLCAVGFVVCPVVNYLTKGPAWSIVAMWGIVFFWRAFLSPDILEFNSIGQVFRFGSFAIIETTLIGLFISPGWLSFVLPIMGFSVLVFSSFLFLVGIDKRKNSLMPLIWEIVLALTASIVMFVRMPRLNWPTITLGAVAIFLAMFGTVVFHSAIWRELKKRFHTK